jgi:predicted Zn-dependent protease
MTLIIAVLAEHENGHVRAEHGDRRGRSGC